MQCSSLPSLLFAGLRWHKIIKLWIESWILKSSVNLDNKLPIHIYSYSHSIKTHQLAVFYQCSLIIFDRTVLTLLNFARLNLVIFWLLNDKHISGSKPRVHEQSTIYFETIEISERRKAIIYWRTLKAELRNSLISSSSERKHVDNAFNWI